MHIIDKTAAWYKTIGTKNSSGTKLLSISGDCKLPGIYEIEWGTSIHKVLEMCGAENVQAVQVAGPSGVCISPKQFERKLDFDDLATGGSIIVIGQHRDLLKDVVLNFMDFFTEDIKFVFITPGSIIMILIPKGDSSYLIDSLNPSSANFELMYAGETGKPILPATELTFTTIPDFCLRITGKTA